jgi:predicted dehydrogenase
MATYALNLTQAQNEVTLTLICERGSIRTQYAKKRISEITEPDGEWQHHSFSLDDIDEIYVTQDSAFLDAIEGRGEVLCSLEEGIRTLRVNLASLESAATTTWQTLS